MDLGPFSISLNVKNLTDSLEFYQALGFSIVGGDLDDNWLMLRNGSAMIGLFHGMFEQNILTFNPQNLRELQKELQAKGYNFELNDESKDQAEGPAHALFADPDDNLILLDQM